MRGLLLTIDKHLKKHRWLVLVAWLLTVGVSVPLAMHQSDHLSGGGYGIHGSESTTVDNKLAVSFGGHQATLMVMLVPERGDSVASMDAAVSKVASVVSGTAHASLPQVSKEQALAKITATSARQPVFLPLRLTVDEVTVFSVTTSLYSKLGLDSAQRGKTMIYLVGPSATWTALQSVSKQDLGRSELIGFPIVALILLIVFGSLLAASLPLLLGAGSVMVTGAMIYLLSMTMEMSIFVTNMASMVGIGVAVDYSLFILARYREEISSGKDPEEARRKALATSGVAVAFSGLTVIASLAGLYLVNATAVRSMAVGAIVVVAVSVLAATTLLPALLSTLGTSVHGEGKLLTFVRRKRPAKPSDFWERWTRMVTAKPLLTVALASSVLIALAVPALHLHTSEGAMRQLPQSNLTRQGFKTASSLIGAGAITPTQVFAPAAQVGGDERIIAADKAVSHFQVMRSRDGRSFLISVTLRYDSESSQAVAAVTRLRQALPRATLVGGNTAYINDFVAEVSSSMWKVALFVMVTAFVVLMLLLGSLLLPLKAVVMDILSVGAAFGVLTLAFGTIDALTLPIILAVVFGLSMDYEVFLLSRIRERYEIVGDTKLAVAQGLASSAKIITSAALIMVCVFSIFALTGVQTVRELGLGCAVAIAVDATIVRLMLVPALMMMFGDWNWWLPPPLRRLLGKGI